MRIVCCAILAFALAAPLRAGEFNHVVGTKGAKLVLSDDWQRKTLNSNMGRDQFMAKRNLFMFVIEHEIALRQAAEYDKTINLFLEGIKAQDPAMTWSNRTFETQNGVGHASAVANCKVNGISISYEVHLVGRDGLFYQLVSWSAVDDRRRLTTEMKRIVANFEMPGVRSAWAKSTVAAPDTFRSAGRIFKLSYQPAIFTMQEKASATYAYSMASKDSEMKCYFFLEEEQTKDAGNLVRSITAHLKKETPDLVEVKREPVTVAGRNCLQAVLQGPKTIGEPAAFVVTVIPLEETQFLEVRFHVTTRLEWRKAYLDELLRTIEIAAAVKVDAFPEVAPKRAVVPLAPAQQRLLAASARVASFDTMQNRGQRLADGSIVGIGWERVSLFRPGATNAVVLHTFGERQYSRQADYGDGALWVADGKGKLTRIREGKSDVIPCKASHVAVAGNGALLLGRAQKPAGLPGFTPMGGSQLILREKDGRERVLRETSLPIAWLALDSASRNALVVTMPEWQMRPLTGSDTELAVVELASGKAHPLAAWQSVLAVSGGDNGWLVEGQPKEKPTGLYQLTPDGQLRLLIGGNRCHGVALTRDELFYSTDLESGEAGVGSGRRVWQVYRAPLAAVAKEGPAWQPFHGELVQRIAARAFAEARLSPHDAASFTNRAQVDAFFARAQEASRALAGVELPVTPAGVDDFLGDYSVHQGLRSEGVFLLSVVLTEALLGQKAEWCEESPAAIWPDRGGVIEREESPFVLALAPGAVVAGMLYDEENGWYRPVSRLETMAQGRAVVLCRDPAALAARRPDENSRKLRELLKDGKVDDLAAFLQARSPNTYLRELVYLQLASTRPAAELEQLAGKVGGAEPPLVDLKLLLSARAARAGEGDQAPLIQSLRAAIARFPEEPSFYHLLGQAYEKGGPGEPAECARKCYEAALRLAPYGETARDAKSRLAGIDRKPGAAVVPEEDDEE